MAVTIRMFAILRELAGTEAVEVEHEPGMTVDDALARLVTDGVLEQSIIDEHFMCAVNHAYGTRTEPLADGDELALIPPVSGG